MLTGPFVVAFSDAVVRKRKVLLKFYSKEDGTILQRKCAPMDIGPSRRAKEKDDRFHLWDYESDRGSHVLSIKPDQVVDLIVLDEIFDPKQFVTWDTKRSPWFLHRDWGEVS